MRTSLLAFAAFQSTPVLAQPNGGWGGSMFGDWGWGHMAFGGAAMLAVWGGIILLVVLLIRGLAFSGPRDGGPLARQTALEVLQERYARGEIDKQEYDERRRTLTAG